jgi:hypothetical protein
MIAFVFAEYGKRSLGQAKIYAPGQESDKEQSKKSNRDNLGLL